MTTYIALLKGINVGGRKIIPMAVLRELFTEPDFVNVQTYIQSGNVIFQSSKSNSELTDDIQKAIASHFGFEVTVILKTRDALQIIFDACPFGDLLNEESYFIMFDKTPEQEALKTVESISYQHEKVVIIKDALYFYSAVGYGNAKFKLNNYERKLNVLGTARNFYTMYKLLSLSEEK